MGDKLKRRLSQRRQLNNIGEWTEKLAAIASNQREINDAVASEIGRLETDSAEMHTRLMEALLLPFWSRRRREARKYLRGFMGRGKDEKGAP